MCYILSYFFSEKVFLFFFWWKGCQVARHQYGCALYVRQTFFLSSSAHLTISAWFHYHPSCTFSSGSAGESRGNWFALHPYYSLPRSSYIEPSACRRRCFMIINATACHWGDDELPPRCRGDRTTTHPLHIVNRPLLYIINSLKQVFVGVWWRT